MHMNFQPDIIYHIYNRGNQQQNIFINHDNYIYFLEKMRKYILPRCEILCWCLMPNHFHFLVYTNEESGRLIPKTPIPIQNLTEGIRLLLSSYAKGLQKQQGFKGNLFQQKTKTKAVSGNNTSYGVTAFHYIHQNPYKSNLVRKMEDWEFSSFRDYIAKGSGSLCNKKLGVSLLDLDIERFYEESYQVIPESNIKMIF
jgi:REP-associated tyrosine transposase